MTVTGLDVTCRNYNGFWRVSTTSPSTESIGVVAMTSMTSAELYVSTNLNNPSPGSPPAYGCVNWGGAYDVGLTSFKVQARIHGNLTGQLDANVIYRLDIDGDVLAQITHDPPSTTPIPNLGIIDIGNDDNGGNLYHALVATRGNIGNVTVRRVGGSGGDATGSIHAERGSITGTITIEHDLTGNVRVGTQLTSGEQNIEAVRVGLAAGGGDLEGDIIAPRGSIKLVDVEGNIGTSSSLSTIQAGVFLRNIAADAIYANIIDTTTPRNLQVHRIETRSGVFKESVDAEIFAHTTDSTGATGVYIVGGDLDANVTLALDLRVPVEIAGSLPAGRTLKVGRGLLTGQPNSVGSIWIKTAQGLDGQIILNAANGTTGAFQWEGDIKVGPVGSQIVLGPNGTGIYYSTTSAALGGGAAGHVPYHLHDTDCDPPNGTTVSHDDAPTTWRLRHYGPVTWNPNYKPARVYYKFPSQSWNEATEITADFSMSPGTNDRDVLVTPLTPADWDDVDYKIEPVLSGNGILKCSGLLVSGDVPVADYDYIIYVR